MRVANHVRFSWRTIDIGFDGGAISDLKNFDGRSARPSQRARVGKMAARQSTGMFLRRSYAGRSPENVLVDLHAAFVAVIDNVHGKHAQNFGDHRDL